MPEPGNAHGPDQLDLGAIRSEEGFFLRRSAVQGPFVPEPNAEGASWRFCSTFRNSPPTLRDAVLDLIRNAQRKVFVTSFILGDDELTEVLGAAADRLTGGVYVISEISEESLRKGLRQLAEIGEDPGQKVEAEKKRFVSLVRRGIAVRGHENCHAKFVVVDDTIAWIGSANLETRAFTKVGEVGVVTTDPAEVNRLARLFAKMWLAGCTREIPNTANDYFVDKRIGASVPFSVPEPATGPQPSVVWTGSAERSLLNSIHDVISRCRQRLVLASWSLNGMAGRADLLLDPLAEAIARGVKVDMLIRAMNHRDRHRRDADLLHKLGVRIFADELNHAKAVLADSRHGVLFSANFDAQHGLDPGSGIEVGARLDGTPALPELARYLCHAIDNATHVYVHAPTSRQLNEALDARWQQQWPLPEKITLHTERRTWQKLVTESLCGPILWTRRPDQPVELLAGRSRLQLRTRADYFYQLDQLPPSDKPAHDQLTQWWGASSTNHDRGYCPAIFKFAPSDT